MYIRKDFAKALEQDLSIYRYVGSRILSRSFLPMLLLLLAACRKDVSTVDLGASIKDYSNASSKVFIDANRYVCWATGDSVCINGSNYLVDVQYGDNSHAVIHAVDAADHYLALYPSSFVQLPFSSSTPRVRLPFVQHYRTVSAQGATYQNVTSPVVASCSSREGPLEFHNACALLRITITNIFANEAITIRQIAVATSGGKAWLSGVAFLSGHDIGQPVLAPTRDTTHAVVLDCASAAVSIAPSDSHSFYVVVPPINCPDQTFRISVRANTSGNVCYDYVRSQSGSAHCVLSRNSITTVNVDFGDNVFTQQAPPFLGKGTATDPYIIANLDDLLKLRSLVNADTCTFYNSSDRHYRQIANISLNEPQWTPIGDTSATPFRAHYDGGGFTVDNLKYDIPTTSTSTNSMALFGYAGGGSIRNITVSGAASCSAMLSAAGLIGTVVGNLSVVACTNRMSMTLGGTKYTDRSSCGYGGIVGKAESGPLSISYCVNEGSITVPTNGVPNSISRFRLAGILGLNLSAGTTVYHCKNYASIERVCLSNFIDTSSVAGIVAFSQQAIEICDCHNLGSSQYLQGCRVGGIAAYVGPNSIVESCQNTMPIVVAINYSGGIVGHLASGQITNCYNASPVQGQTNHDNKKELHLYFGGIVGYCEGASTLMNCACRNAVTGYNYVGGVVGYAASSIAIRNCFMDAGISCSSTSCYAAGILAGCSNVSNVSIVNCYFNGTVPITNNKSNICSQLVSNPQGYASLSSSTYLNSAAALFNADGAFDTHGVACPTLGDALRAYRDEVITSNHWSDGPIPVLNIPFSH